MCGHLLELQVELEVTDFGVGVTARIAVGLNHLKTSRVSVCVTMIVTVIVTVIVFVIVIVFVFVSVIVIVIVIVIVSRESLPY